MPEEKRKPDIRFAGFTDAWEQRKLNTFSTYSSSPLTNNDINENGEYDLYDANGIVGKTNKSPNIVNYISIIKDGAGVGRVRKLPKNTSILGTMGAIIPNNSNYDFLYVLLENTEFNKLTSGGTIPHIYFKQYSEELYYIPELSEQQQIGAYFRTLDHLITLHQRKCESLKNVKKSLLEKMFPQNGSNFPEIRFAGFTDAWEQRKLGELSSTTIGEFVIKTKQDPNSPYPVFNGGVSNTGFYNEFNKEGDHIIISARGANAGYINIYKGKYWAGNSCYSVSINESSKQNIDFIYQEMKRNQHLFTDYQQSASIPAVSKADVEKFCIQFPSINEQQQIGTFFKNLDDLIALHQRESKLTYCLSHILTLLSADKEET